MAGHVHRLALVVADVVGVEVQLGTVDEVDARAENRILLAQERLEELGRHRRLDAHARDEALRRADGLNDAVRAVACAEVEAQLVEPGLAQHPQVFLVGERAVGVHVLMDAGLVEAADDTAVELDLHERLQVDVGDAGGAVRHGEQQIDVLLAILAPADLPHALADGRLTIELAIVVAEAALDVASVRLADSAQPRAQQAGAAALRKAIRRADKARAPLERLQMGNLPRERVAARLLGQLDLGEHGVDQLLLMGEQLLLLGQRGEEFKPHQGVLFGNLHGSS